MSRQALQRMPIYLQFLKTLREEGKTEVSAPFLADHFGLTEIQVRKDLSAVSSVQGKPKVGFRLIPLIQDIEEELGFKKGNTAVLAGAGSIGSALLSYRDFREYGVRIKAAFDTNRAIIGTEIAGIPVLDARDLKSYCRKEDVRMGIIAVPPSAALSVCNSMVKAGIKAIWNFTQIHLNVPDGVMVHNENMAASVAILFHHLDSCS